MENENWFRSFMSFFFIFIFFLFSTRSLIMNTDWNCVESYVMIASVGRRMQSEARRALVAHAYDAIDTPSVQLASAYAISRWFSRVHVTRTSHYRTHYNARVTVTYCARTYRESIAGSLDSFSPRVQHWWIEVSYEVESLCSLSNTIATHLYKFVSNGVYLYYTIIDKYVFFIPASSSSREKASNVCKSRLLDSMRACTQSCHTFIYLYGGWSHWWSP